MTGAKGNVAAPVLSVCTADTFHEAAITSVLVKRLQVDSALCASEQHPSRLTPLFRRQRQVIALESDSDSESSSADIGVVVTDPLVSNLPFASWRGIRIGVCRGWRRW